MHAKSTGAKSAGKTPCKSRGKKQRKRPSRNTGLRAAGKVLVEQVTVTPELCVPLRGPLKSASRERFCQALLVEPNATAAAIKAGYSPATAKSQASRLLTFADIQQRMAGLYEKCQHRSILRRRDVLVNASIRAQGAMVDLAPLLGLRWDEFTAAIKHHPAGKCIRKVKMGREFDRVTQIWSSPYVREIELYNPKDAETMLADLLGWNAAKRVQLEAPDGGGLLVLPAPVAPVIGELLPAAGGGAAPKEGA
jgi:hypothetical protein